MFFWTVGDAGPYNEKSNFFMRGSISGGFFLVVNENKLFFAEKKSFSIFYRILYNANTKTNERRIIKNGDKENINKSTS